MQAAAIREPIIVATELTARRRTWTHSPHGRGDEPQPEALGREPVGVLVADAGYYSDRNVQGIGEAGPELVSATRSAPGGASRPSSPSASGWPGRWRPNAAGSAPGSAAG